MKGQHCRTRWNGTRWPFVFQPMAFVPDDALARKRNAEGKRIISPAEWDVYEQLCAFADTDTGIVEARHWPKEKLAAKTGLKLGTVKNALHELRKKLDKPDEVGPWIIEERDGRFHLYGTFLKERRKQKRKSKAPSPDSDDLSSISDAASPDNDGAINRSRARVLTNPRTKPDQLRAEAHMRPLRSMMIF